MADGRGAGLCVCTISARGGSSTVVCVTSVLPVSVLQVDGHYTQEALKAEEREVVLRQRLAQLDEEVQRTVQVDMANRFVLLISC